MVQLHHNPHKSNLREVVSDSPVCKNPTQFEIGEYEVGIET